MASFTIASDYDGTLAEDGQVSPATLAALRRFRRAGHRLLMVTGRELDDLLTIFPEHNLFERIVAENGALIYTPETKHEELLTTASPAELVARLHARGVGPLYVGRVIIATFREHEETIRQSIAELGLAMNLICNAEAVMILPAGINKASGLDAARRALSIAREHTIGIGDAENDFDLLAAAGFGVAVANAVAELKAQAHWVTNYKAGAGVTELIDLILEGRFLPETTALNMAKVGD